MIMNTYIHELDQIATFCGLAVNFFFITLQQRLFKLNLLLKRITEV